MEMDPEIHTKGEKSLALELERILEIKSGDRLDKLRDFGFQNGFIDFSIRSRVYMALLGITEADLETYQLAMSIDSAQETDEVIVNDAKRSFIGYRELSELPEEDLLLKRKELSHILHYFFKRHKCFSYYQGMNTFGELFIMVFGKSLAYLMLEKYALNYLRKYMGNEDFELEVRNQTFITLHILDKELPEFRRFFRIGENGEHAQEKLGFIVSWIVTWFSYKMKNLKLIFRNFDFLMCAPKHMIAIMVALVIRQIITIGHLSVDSDDDEVFLAFYSQSLDSINWPLVYQQASFLEQTEDYGKMDYRQSPNSLRGIIQNLKLKFKAKGNNEEKGSNAFVRAGQKISTTSANLFQKGLNFGKSLFKKKD